DPRLQPLVRFFGLLFPAGGLGTYTLDLRVILCLGPLQLLAEVLLSRELRGELIPRRTRLGFPRRKRLELLRELDTRLTQGGVRRPLAIELRLNPRVGVLQLRAELSLARDLAGEGFARRTRVDLLPAERRGVFFGAFDRLAQFGNRGAFGFEPPFG